MTCTGCHPSDKPIPILNLKWYVYLKMERYPTFTKSGKLDINHFQKWVDRHVFGKIKDLFTAEMLHKDTGRLFGTTYPQYQYGIKAFSKIYNEKFGFQVGDLTYFMENLNLSIDNNYNLKVSIEYKFLVKKEKL